MALTIDDIYDKEFALKGGGYDRNDVDQFLDQICDEMANMMNKKSGFLGLSGISSDCRDIEVAAEQGDEKAKLVLDMYFYQLQKFVGSYTAAMNGLDVMVFTAGIGENSANVREGVCEGLGYFGVEIDKEQNKKRGMAINDITGPNSKVKVLVVATNEELMIARDTMNVVNAK